MRVLKSGRFNIEAVIKLSILLGFAFFFLITIWSGRAQFYVHPRIVPYIKFGIAAMFLIALFILGDIFKPRRKKTNLFSYLLFIIPLFLAFALPPQYINSSSMSLGEMKIGAGNDLQDNVGVNGETQNEAGADVTESPSGSTANTNTPAGGSASGTTKQGLELQGDTIFMDDDNFIMWLQEIFDHMDKYEGKKIQLVGFVLKDKQFKPDEFVPARLMMVCCAADLQPVGLMAHYRNASGLESGSWIKVAGKIGRGEFSGQETPVIEVDTVESVQKPKNEYVYPY